ncbi:Ankyrin repeat-containing domain protein [Hyaloscypha variabilis]
MDPPAEIVWGFFESTLRTLYLEQDLSLKEVMHEMAAKYQFNATKSQYELQFKKWQFRKNRTADEWKIVARKLAERKNEHKESEVVLNGNLINPKKLRKETLRYGSMSKAIQIHPLGPSPPTPEGFIIRTPSPKPAQSMSMLNIHPPINISPILMDCLPFHQFNSIFGHAGNPFLFILENSGSDSVVLSQESQFGVLGELTGSVSGSLSDTIKALLPENIFPGSPTSAHMAISHRQSSSVLHFLKLSMYLVSNNFFGPTTDISEKVYQWLQRHSNGGLMEYILSIGGPTVEALAENLFRLALDAEDVATVSKMMKLGINPNEQVYHTEHGTCCTPLLRACEMQSLNLVRALIDGGAKADYQVGNEDIESVLMFAVDGRDDNYELKPHVDTELVRILLNAGAVVNPGPGESPLSRAVDWGHVEVVDLLVSAGADVNIVVGDDSTPTPLTTAIGCDLKIPDGDVINMTRILLLAGADPQQVATRRLEAETPLEAAMARKNIELIQLLLDYGARVTEQSLVEAVHRCDISVVKLLLNSGGQVTESVIKSAVEYNSTLVFFLLDTAGDRTKGKCKTAALIKSIEHGEMALIQDLSASGAQLTKNNKLEDAIQQVIKSGNTPILDFLLDEKSGHRTPSLESLGTGLWTAIDNSRNDIVELLLMAGANTNSTHGRLSESPLLGAIIKKDLRLVKQLLVAGAAVNGIEGPKGSLEYTHATTVLPAVVDWGYCPLIHDIINAGAEIDAVEPNGCRNALFVAAEKKSKEIIKLLIDAGANVNAPEAVLSGETALSAASRNNDLLMVRYLLELGADVDEHSLIFGITGSVELVQTLLEARLHRHKRYSRSYGCGALQHAIKLKDPIMIKVLLAKGIDPNAILNKKVGDQTVRPHSFYHPPPTDPREPYLQRGQTALGFAIKSDNRTDSGIVKLLLHGGADPNSIVTDDHRTALLVAIDEGNLGLVKVLIAAGANADPDLRFGIKRTPLQLAAEKGRIDIVNILLDNGADINTPPFDRYGATALQFAAIGGYIGIVQLVIERGADVNASPAKIGGRTALEGAAEHGRIDILQLLLSAGAQVIGTGVRQYDRARELALENGHRAACRLLEKYSREMWENLVAWDDMWMDFGSCEEDLRV